MNGLDVLDDGRIAIDMSWVTPIELAQWSEHYNGILGPPCRSGRLLGALAIAERARRSSIGADPDAFLAELTGDHTPPEPEPGLLARVRHLFRPRKDTA